jgi:hypothetical protein
MHCKGNGLPRDITVEEKEFWSGEGPLWWRGYALEDEEVICPLAEQAIKRLKVSRLVMGHTPFLGNLSLSFNPFAYLSLRWHQGAL